MNRPTELNVKVVVSAVHGAAGSQASAVSYDLVTYEETAHKTFTSIQPSRWFPAATVLASVLPVGSTGRVRTIGATTTFIPDHQEQPRTTTCP